MNILFIGDIFGNLGRHVVLDSLDRLVTEHSISLCICNGENAAGGIGITGNIFKKLRKYGVHAVTGGNHSFAYAEADRTIFDFPELLRPLNYPPGNPGRGTALIKLADGQSVGIVNLQGRTFFHESLDCPFRMGLEAVEKLRE